MRVWVDADACPGAVKDIVATAANRRSVTTVFVANKDLPVPASPYLCVAHVDVAPDAADNFIKDHAEGWDLVVTQDIPMAHALVSRGIVVRSEEHTLNSSHVS